MFSSGETEIITCYVLICISIVKAENKALYRITVFPPGITVWLSCRDVISLWNLCCAEQRFSRYCAIFELSVTKLCFFPLGPPHSIISLRRWETDTRQHTSTLSLRTKWAVPSNALYSKNWLKCLFFTPVDMESVSLQRKRRVTVRRWFFISYTMIPLAQTPKTNSPTTGLFSRPTRWNITPYSGNCWAIWGVHILYIIYALHFKMFCFNTHSNLKEVQQLRYHQIKSSNNKCTQPYHFSKLQGGKTAREQSECVWVDASVVWTPSGTLFLPLQGASGHDLHVVLAALPWQWARPASPASSWTHNALAGNNSCHTTKKDTQNNQMCSCDTRWKMMLVFLDVRWTFFVLGTSGM